MIKTYSLQFPTVSDFKVRYYFSNTLEPIKTKKYPPHMNDTVEFYILLEGDVSFMVENTLYKLSAGDAIITKPNEVHNCIVNSTSVHNHICFWFEPTCEVLFADFLKHEYGENNLYSLDAEEKTRLLSLYERLETASKNNDDFASFYIMLEIIDIFKKSVTKDALSATLPLPEILQTILNDISKNLTIINDLSYFTEKYFISQSTLNRLFHTHLRTTPKLYLESKKLAYSRVLLREGKTVLTACMESGFSDYSNYIRLFKKRFMITPKQYKDK